MIANTVPTEAWWLAADGSALHSGSVVGWERSRSQWREFDPIVLGPRGPGHIAGDACLLLPAGQRPGPEHFDTLLDLLVEQARSEVADSELLQLAGEYVGRREHLMVLAAATGRTLHGARSELRTLAEALATSAGLAVVVDEHDMVEVSRMPAGACSASHMAGAATLAATLAEVAS